MNTLTEGFQEIYFRILNFLVGGGGGLWGLEKFSFPF